MLALHLIYHDADRRCPNADRRSPDADRRCLDADRMYPDVDRRYPDADIMIEGAPMLIEGASSTKLVQRAVLRLTRLRHSCRREVTVLTSGERGSQVVIVINIFKSGERGRGKALLWQISSSTWSSEEGERKEEIGFVRFPVEF